MRSAFLESVEVALVQYGCGADDVHIVMETVEVMGMVGVNYPPEVEATSPH